MIKTIAIQIGNTDDKLSQVDWAAFVNQTDVYVSRRAKQVHFCGYSNPTEPWQNAAWIFEISENESAVLWDEMKVIAGAYRQDFIAWTEGNTVFAEAVK